MSAPFSIRDSGRPERSILEACDYLELVVKHHGSGDSGGSPSTLSDAALEAALAGVVTGDRLVDVAG